MAGFRKTVPVDDYVLDILMRDLVGHDQQPGAFLVYLHLYRAAEKRNWQPVAGSVRAIADGTGLSKSAVQMALETLRRRELIESASVHATAIRRHRVLRHWRRKFVRGPRSKSRRVRPTRRS
jgi:DNA-binding MarR family transcriptional regulator